MKNRFLLLSGRHWILLSLLLWLFWSLGCAPASPEQTPATPREPATPVEQPKAPETPGLPIQSPERRVTQEEAQKIAIGFVRNEATFRFDGMQDTLKLVRSGGDEMAGRWEFEYTYQSRQAGYGDRSGLILAQVITNHRAKIVVEPAQVTYGVLDGKWDMLRQEMLK